MRLVSSLHPLAREIRSATLERFTGKERRKRKADSRGEPKKDGNKRRAKGRKREGRLGEKKTGERNGRKKE